jgi:Ala-tRNA(Pro) deacylase
MSETVFQRVDALLKRQGARFQVLRHRPVYTSEEAAEVRGTPLASGAKALVCKADDRFVMFVIPANLKLGGKEIRRAKGWRKLRFATREEVEQLTGLAPGSIPPFGSLFDLPTLCDARLGENEVIHFNAGDHSISISLPYADYLRVESPELGSFAEERGQG